MKSTALAAPAVTAILKPGFTALSNGLIDSGLLAQLKPTELALFLVLSRFSTGFLRLRAIVGEAKLVELTGSSPSTLYEAKRGLVQRGLIVVSHTRTGRCCYELARAFQPVLAQGEIPEPVARPTWSNPSGQLNLNPSDSPESIKTTKKTSDHHMSQTQLPSTNDDAFSTTLSSKDSERSPDGRLVDRLRELGVNEIMAYRLAKTADLEVIEKAISRLKTLNVANPAGYLVSECLRGGYQEKADPHKAQREQHLEIQQKRQLERQRVDHERQIAQTQAESLWQAFKNMPHERQDEIRERVNNQAIREDFCRIPGWSEAHPAWRGLVLETISREHVTTN